MTRIIFVFPYRGQGGVPVVFAQIANYLSRQDLASCYIVDYEDGLLYSLVDKDIKRLSYSDSSDLVLPGDSYVVMQAMTPWSIYPRIIIQPSSKVYFWSLGPGNFTPISRRLISKLSLFLPPFVISWLLRPLIRKVDLYIDFLLSHDSLAFMDKTCLSSASSILRRGLTAPLLAVPFSIGEQDVNTIAPPGSGISHRLNVTWVGRVEDFKTFSLLSFATQLNSLAEYHSLDIALCVVGTGTDIAMTTSALDSLQYLDVSYVSNVDFHNLSEFLVESTHMVYAMGTSALFASSLGLPTVLAPIVYNRKVEHLAYHWLHESDGFSLGDISSAQQSLLGKDLSLLLNELLHDYDLLSLSARSYVKKHHNISTISSQLISSLESSSLQFGDPKLTKLLHKPIVYRIYNFIRYFAL